MARLLTVALTAILAGLVAAQDDLLDCGDSRFFPSQYTCFDDDFLCPILNGDIYIRCGDACYSTDQYTCSDDTLQPYNLSGPETLEDCGDARFFPSQYVCLDGDFLCPTMNGNATLRCGDACFSPAQYNCTDGQLAPVAPPPPPCVPEFGDSEICNDQGCILLTCCPGLISVATKCRDPCMLAAEQGIILSGCPNGTTTTATATAT
ncbi:hypothetical protein D9757_009664 [Collybiopsis confluens]|uniref:Endo-1,3(4)-beta-glucanase 1 carbohydrate binding domain-containing protein n=1 Tax=Collybiopsis confluens TaxID=2823264 RepID=A0A8H5H236_9AGAR|nr:hypothetical protein D9757_009664 [Collybiopsis confluens]